MIRLILSKLVVLISYWLYRLIGLLLSFCLLFYFFFATNAGLRLSIDCLSLIIPGQLSIEEAKGSWLSGVTLTHLFYMNSTIQISISSVHLAWNPQRLLHKKLLITDLTGQNITVNLLSTQSSTSVNTQTITRLLSLLRYLFIDHINISHFSLLENIFMIECCAFE